MPLFYQSVFIFDITMSETKCQHEKIPDAPSGIDSTIAFVCA